MAKEIITKETVERVAGFARLTFSEERMYEFIKEFEQILEFVEQIKDSDTDGLEPLIQPLPEQNILREDKLEDSMPLENIERNAPDFDDRSIIVPRVL